MDRRCGVLLPVASLPSRYGIGCFSKEAYEFVDFLADAGQSYWQILPLGQTGYGDSPYQSFSTFAGNPYFIDPEALIKAGYIDKKTADQYDFGKEPRTVDYEKIYRNRYTLLRRAYANSPFCLSPAGKWAEDAYNSDRRAFEDFRWDNSEWLPDYALFSAVKEYFDGDMFTLWPEDIRLRRTAAMDSYRIKLDEEIRFYEFLQFLFAQQWKALKEYAHEKGIRIIGDIPIYVAFDSADTWSHPELFEFDENGFPTVVAGVPPDAFSATGQLWGNPIYRWKYHKATGYDWWIKRLDHVFKLYDIVRIDHFRGFDEFWAVPYGAGDAMGGKWKKGPGYSLFAAMKQRLGEKEIIAEDLGYLTKSVLRLVKRTGFPGMKVLQFAFESGADNAYLPHNYTSNAVVYTGTHDNDTTRGWYIASDEKQLEFINKYAGIHCSQTATWELIRLAMQSVADTAVIPIQDYLDIGSAGRINTPSTLGGNWCWRLLPGELTEDLAARMKEFAQIYGRISK
ncbi:MAG: 4-alpha-glucanotransferase [Lachnospiraceae bacterium]|nr:4-alpha-glucanotransferase [Lachnospiraceae bacterium]